MTSPRDQENLINTERLLLSLKWKDATKEMRINYFLERSNVNWT
jgi:hypothetical protein